MDIIRFANEFLALPWLLQNLVFLDKSVLIIVICWGNVDTGWKERNWFFVENSTESPEDLSFVSLVSAACWKRSSQKGLSTVKSLCSAVGILLWEGKWVSIQGPIQFGSLMVHVFTHITLCISCDRLAFCHYFSLPTVPIEFFLG